MSPRHSRRDRRTARSAAAAICDDASPMINDDRHIAPDRLHPRGLRRLPRRARASRRGSPSCAARPGRRSSDCRCPTAAHEEWRRTDIRGCSGSTSSACRRRRPPRRAVPPALLDRRRRAGRQHGRRSTAVRVATRARCEVAPTRACCSAVSTTLVRRARRRSFGRICSRRPSIRGRQVRRAARRLLVGRDAALRAARRGDRRAAAHALGPVAPAASICGHTLVILEEGAEATLLAETASLDADGRRPALRRDRAPRRPAGAAALREPAELGHAASGTSPIRRPWSTATPRCSGPSAPWAAGWPRSISTWSLVGRGRRRPGQRRDVHRGQAAPLVPHAAAPRRRRTARATCSTRAPCRTSRDSSGAA